MSNSSSVKPPVPALDLNISEEKMANFKSPVFVKLEQMIEMVAMFRNEMDGKRIPKFE